METPNSYARTELFRLRPKRLHTNGEHIMQYLSTASNLMVGDFKEAGGNGGEPS